jgi:phage terminase small subunit
MKNRASTKKSCKSRPALNSRRLTFCKEYIIDFNGSRAAICAGFAENSARSTASFLLTNPNIQAEIDRLRKAREDRLEASADFVVRELMRIAKFDIRQAYDSDGSLKAPHDLPDDVAKVISSVEVDELYEGVGKDREKIGVTKKIKTWDKIRALEALGEHFGIFKRPGDTDPAKDEKKKQLDLLQIIKIMSKDGKSATVIENRFGGAEKGSPVVDQSCARGYEIL